MSTNLTVYYDEERGELPYCVDFDYFLEGNHVEGSTGFRFHTPELAGEFVAKWLREQGTVSIV